MGVLFNQIPNALQHEFLGIETQCVTRTAHRLGKLVQQGQGGFVGNKEVKQPSTCWVSFHAVEEAAEAALKQSLAQSVAASMYSPVSGTPRLHHSPPICVALPPLRRRNTDGAEVARRSAARVARSVILPVFIRMTPKPCSKTIDRQFSGGVGDLGPSGAAPPVAQAV